MAMTEDDIDDLKKLLQKARQKPISYGLCLGKKPEDNVLYLDLKKQGEVVMRRAKQDGETGKITHGEATVKGKILTLSVHGKMLPGLARNMKRFMAEQAMKMKVVITDSEGNEIESEGDGDAEDEVLAENKGGDAAAVQAESAAAPEPEAATQTAEDGPAEDDRNAQWEKIADALDPFVKRFVASGHEKAATVSTAWQAAGTAAEKSDYKTALTIAAKLKPLVIASADTPAPEMSHDPNAQKWQDIAGPLETLYERAMANTPENRAQLSAAWTMAVEKAGADDYKTALSIAAKLKPALDKSLAAAAETTQQIPKDVVPFQKSRVLWASTRAKMKQEMKHLEDAIITTCGNDPDLAPIMAEVGGLSKRLEVFDDRLEDILDQITNTPEGETRAGLKKDAIVTLAAYQAALEEDFFKDVDGNNGFVNIAVAATASKSLASIANVLK